MGLLGGPYKWNQRGVVQLTGENYPIYTSLMLIFKGLFILEYASELYCELEPNQGAINGISY